MKNIQKLFFLLLLLTASLLCYQNCGKPLPDTEEDDRSSFGSSRIDLIEAKIIVVDDHLQAFGTCRVSDGVRGEIQWTLVKDSCVNCSPHLFTQSDGCTNGSFNITEPLPNSMQGALLGETYTVKVELTPKDKDTGKTIGQFVKDTIIAYGSSERPTTPIITQDLPATGKAIVGSPYVMEIQVTGPGELAYQWFKDDTSLIRPNNTNRLTLDSAHLSHTGRYKVRVSLLGGQTVDSTELTLTVENPKPKFTIVGPMNTGRYFYQDNIHHSQVEVSCPDGYVGVSPAFKYLESKSRGGDCKSSLRNVVTMTPKDGTNRKTWLFKSRCLRIKAFLNCIRLRP